VIKIPLNYATIQEGIDNANEGDTILVSSGIYFEQLRLNGNNITITSESGAENTIIDGSLLPQQDSLSLLYVINGEDQQTVIDGFTFRYGRGTYINVYSQERGGAIYCSESSFILKNSILVENTGYEGGAIYYTGSESIIENCEFRLNTAEYGGAIYSDFSSLSIFSSLFIENSAERLGGCYFDDFSELYCVKTIMYKCSADNGGAIYSDHVNLDFCTIVSNIAHLGAGGGVFCSNGIIHNSILYFNNGGINNNQIYPTNSPLIVQYCDIKNGWSGIGNINADPLFVNIISEDFSLNENSPCIDAADPNSLLDPDGTRADMGAVFFNQQQNSAVYPLVLEFPNVNIGSSEVKAFTITNIFDSTLTISNFELNSEVFSTENITPFSIPVGDSINVNVTFTPLQVQQYNDSLVINANYELENVLLNGNGIIEYSGVVNGVWRKSESPIVVIGDIIVPTNDTLEIESGVTVKIMNGKKITINGLLRAIGSTDDSIHFTNFEQTNHWWGLQFINSMNNSLLKYCVIERANPDDNIPNNHNPEENGGGIYCVNSNLVVNNSKIINNRAAPVWSFGEGFGGGVYSKNSNILIDSCEISHNIMSHGGGGVYSLNSEILIKNSVIYDNHAEEFAIYGNSSGGGVFVDGGQAQFVNNTISFNSNQGYMNSGGGITITNCEDFLMENTNITNNSAEIGSGIYFGSGSSGSTVKYSDFNSNFPNNFGGSDIPPNLGIITTTNYNGDPCDAFYNIFLNPLFVNAGNGDFHLQADSPCIDAGDPTFPLDPDGTIADIGAFYRQSTFQLSVNVTNGWNMVSVPGTNPDGQGVDIWWAYRDMNANVFKYSNGYQSVTAALPGTGYWMKHLGDRIYNTGDEWPAGGIQIVAHSPLAGVTGWNLIGGYEISATAALVTTVPPGLQQGPIYKYAGGYQTATTIDPGYGYWIKLTGAGQIIIPETLTKGEVEYFPEDWGRIILTDATGVNYTLYAVKGDSPNGGASVDLSQYELPPVPPTGMFDIRFESGRIAEDINSSVKTIDMSGVTYPLTVRVEGMDIRLQDETGKIVNANLKSGQDIVISDATIEKLMVSGELIPTVFSLEQNYPNPFNPSTVIEFSLPENVNSVKLSIYNVLGEKIAELVSTELVAGKYSYQWNASNVATGMYIYELRTDKFVAIKKMLLIK
jgi:hypothetical protein